MTGIELYSTTAANNNSAVPNGWPEGMAPSGVNDSARQMMSAIRTWYESAEWINLGHTPTYISATQFSVTTDLTTTYQVGRRIKAVGTAPFTIYGTISASAYASVTTVTVTWDSGSLDSTLSTIWIAAISVTNKSVAANAISGLTEAITAAAPTAGISLISTATASGSASIAFTTGINSTYDNYIIEARNVIPSTDDTYLILRYSIDGGASYLSTSYVGQTMQIKGSTVNGTTPTDGIHIVPNSAGYRSDSGATNDGINFTANLYGLPLTTVKYTKGSAAWFEAAGSAVIFGNFSGCYRGGVQAVNAIQFVMSSGNIASGKFYLYGLKKS